MKEPNKLEIFIDNILNIPYRIKHRIKQAICNHDFNFEEKEKGWFGTGSLQFLVMCSKCGKYEFIKMKFPPQVDKD